MTRCSPKSMTVRTACPAKISPTRLPAHLARPRLFQALDGGSSHPITWVMGPPGSGKTTLVGSYLRRSGRNVLWYRVDSGDEDPAVFFYYFSLAACRMGGQGLPLPLQSERYHLGVSSFRRWYFASLYCRLHQPFVVVFDDYHNLPDPSPFHAMVCDALAEIPAQGRLICISRCVPPPALAQYQVNGAMAVLDWDDLRLTPKEMKALVRLHRRSGLSDETVRLLHKRTEGWAAGVVLMLDGLRRRTGAGERLGPCRVGTVFDYFEGEVLGRAGPRIQHALQATAFLPRITAEMARRLTGLPEIGEVLAGLSRRHEFTEQIGPGEATYRYHVLFREFLIARANRVHGPEHLAEIQMRVGILLEEAGELDEAMAQLGDSESWEAMKRIVVQQAPNLVARGEGHKLEQWAGRLPSEFVTQDPRLLYWLGVGGLPQNPELSRMRLERAFRLFERQGDETGLFLAWSAAVESIGYGQDDCRPLDTWIAWLDQRLREPVVYPSPAVEARVVCSMAVALMHRQPRRPDCVNWAARALQCSRRLTDDDARLSAGYGAAFFHLWRGDVLEAGAVLEELACLPNADGVSPFVRLQGKTVRAWYHLLGAEFDACLRAVSEGLELACRTGMHLQDTQLRAAGLAAALSQGGLAEAEACSGEPRLVPRGSRRLDSWHDHYYAGWRDLLRGDYPKALVHAEAALQLARETGVPVLEILAHLARAQTLLVQQERGPAAVEIGTVRRLLEGMNSTGLETLCRLTRAELARQEDRPGEALAHLHRAVHGGWRRGFMATPWWRPSTLARLVTMALEAGIEVNRVQAVIERLALVPGRVPVVCECWPWTIRIFTLGRFVVERRGKPLPGGRKVQRRPLQLLKALVAFGGREVSVAALTDALWPEAEGDSGYRDFTVTLHRLRKLLNEERAVTLREARVTLGQGCWVDVWAFDRLFEQAAADPGVGRRAREKALALYQGPFLVEESEPWIMPLRDRLRRKFLRLVDEQCRALERAEQWGQAAELSRQALDKDEGIDALLRDLKPASRTLAGREGNLACAPTAAGSLSATGFPPAN